jgi:simple sugar transport system permease protein
VTSLAPTPSTDPGQGPVAEVATGPVVLAPRSWKSTIIISVVALVTFIGFGVFGADSEVRFVWNDTGQPSVIPPLVVHSQTVGLLLGVLALACAVGAAVFAWRRRRTPVALTFLSALSFLTALVAWVGEGGDVPVVFLLTGTIGLSTAVIFGSLAGVIGERVGVVNIAIEGQLLGGAFTAAVVASVTDNLYVGLLAGMITGALISMVLVTFSIKYLVDQIIVGVVLITLMFGLTNFFYSAALADNGQTLNFPGTLPFLPIPLLSDIPVIGPVLFDQRLTTYIMFVLIPVVWFFLFKTRWGLRIRALGEHPLAADTVGINVNRWRFWTVTAAGLIAGLGGAALTLGSIGPFVRDMSAGQGFIALACVILGRWNPFLAAAAALLFGFSRNFRIWAGQAGSEIPPDLIAMTPYLVTLIAVAVLVGRAVGPRAAGKPYVKE